MGLSASQGRLLLLTARQNDLEFRAQQISQKRLVLSQQLEEIAMDYENATSNRQMNIQLYLTAGGEAITEKTPTRTTNLTYTDLISGLYGWDSSATGIKLSENMADREYKSNIPYRLVDASGAIVVSSENEIPSYTTIMTGDAEAVNGVYQVDDLDSSGEVISTAFYLDMGKVTTEGNTRTDGICNLADFYAKNGDATREADWDDTNNIVRLSKDGITYYFDTKTGQRLDTDENNKVIPLDDNGNPIEDLEKHVSFTQKNNAKLTIVEDAENLQTEYKAQGTDQIEYKTEERSDGKTELYYISNGRRVTVGVYVVDEALAYGSTDLYGDKTSPNYLQDCLRNGKYLLEKGKADAGSDKGIRWSSISWDATGNISDQYYTEDDDKAKAKYDRLQQQIQNQDKKLEIELDNIETQRSAVTTEVESVEKVIQENIEGSFNAFG